jgi:hypothetical protein
MASPTISYPSFLPFSAETPSHYLEQRLSIVEEDEIEDEETQLMRQVAAYTVVEEFSSTGEGTWGRLNCTWVEKRDGKLLVHNYAACIDGENRDVFIDDTPSKIFAKCVTQLFVRPLFTLAKTVYALSFIPIFCEIKKYSLSKQSGSDTLKNVGKALADIVLTPIFGTILTITTLAAIFFGIISISSMYESRKILGRIEQLSNWGKKRIMPATLAPCFQPKSLEEVKKYGIIEFNDTDYTEMNEIQRALANFARAHIKHERIGDNPCVALFFNKTCQDLFRGFNLFSCSRITEGDKYESPILSEIPALTLYV